MGGATLGEGRDGGEKAMKRYQPWWLGSFEGFFFGTFRTNIKELLNFL